MLASPTASCPLSLLLGFLNPNYRISERPDPVPANPLIQLAQQFSPLNHNQQYSFRCLRHELAHACDELAFWQCQLIGTVVATFPFNSAFGWRMRIPGFWNKYIRSG
jgi:hypothetical protein